MPLVARCNCTAATLSTAVQIAVPTPRKVITMKTLRYGLIAFSMLSALATSAGSVQAGTLGRPIAHAHPNVALHGGGGHSGGQGWGHGFGQRGGFGGHRGSYGGWVAPLVGAAIVGSAIYATMPSPVVVQQPQVIYPQQPAVITDPSRVNYYCQPYQQYYPHVTQCPSPWQIVPY